MQFSNLVFLMTLLVAVESIFWQIDGQTCNSDNQRSLGYAFAELMTIATVAVDCTEGLQQLRPNSCRDYRVTLNTFQSYFKNGYTRGRGTVVLGRSPPQLPGTSTASVTPNPLYTPGRSPWPTPYPLLHLPPISVVPWLVGT